MAEHSFEQIKKMFPKLEASEFESYQTALKDHVVKFGSNAKTIEDKREIERLVLLATKSLTVKCVTEFSKSNLASATEVADLKEQLGKAMSLDDEVRSLITFLKNEFNKSVRPTEALEEIGFTKEQATDSYKTLKLIKENRKAESMALEALPDKGPKAIKNVIVSYRAKLKQILKEAGPVAAIAAIGTPQLPLAERQKLSDFSGTLNEKEKLKKSLVENRKRELILRLEHEGNDFKWQDEIRNF
jgi:hypothetical protein